VNGIGMCGYLKINRKYVFLFLGLFAVPFLTLVNSANASTDIVSKLSQLDPLPKVHYSWAWPKELLNDPDSRLLCETARITNSVSISARWAREVQVKNAVYTCARINKTNPKISATIGINYNPYHHWLDPSVPPTYRGKTYKKDLQELEKKLTLVSGWIQKYNKYYKSAVQVGAVLLDAERFKARPYDDKWTEAMREALDTVHVKVRNIFPDARIEWYGRGMRWISNPQAWVISPYFTGKEKNMPSLSCSLYYVPEIERTLERYRRTVKLADELNVEDVTPWVALASGQRRRLETTFRFENDWDYDIIYSYLIGSWINRSWFGSPKLAKQYAPFNRAKVVIFYPPPFYEKTPNWGKHFVAYVRGASGVKELGDLGYDTK